MAKPKIKVPDNPFEFPDDQLDLAGSVTGRFTIDQPTFEEIEPGWLVDPILARKFILAGNATVTFKSNKTGERFTYKIQAPIKEGSTSARDLDSQMRFVKVLTGPNNGTDYQYLGFMRREVYFHGGLKSRITRQAPSAKAFDWVYSEMLTREKHMPTTIQIWHEGSCCRCGRPLTVPESIRSGFGPECAGKMGW